MKTKILLLIAGIILVSYKHENSENVLVVGLNSKHQIANHLLPTKLFQRTIGRLLNNSSQNIIEGLNTQQLDTPATNQWKLNRVTVGLELGFEVEMAEFLEMELAPAIELKFEPIPQNIERKI